MIRIVRQVFGIQQQPSSNNNNSSSSSQRRHHRRTRSRRNRNNQNSSHSHRNNTRRSSSSSTTNSTSQSQSQTNQINQRTQRQQQSHQSQPVTESTPLTNNSSPTYTNNSTGTSASSTSSTNNNNNNNINMNSTVDDAEAETISALLAIGEDTDDDSIHNGHRQSSTMNANSDAIRSSSSMQVPFGAEDGDSTTISLLNNNGDHHGVHGGDIERGQITNSSTNTSESNNNNNTNNNTQNNSNNNNNDDNPDGNGGGGGGTEDDDDDNEEELEESIRNLTNRLKYLFRCLTFPILLLGPLFFLQITNLLYAAFVSEYTHTCSHPLKGFAFTSLALFLYSTKHNAVRNRLFGYDRARNGPVRPRSVIIYDQCFYCICFWYVYYGMTILSVCEDDTTSITDTGSSGDGDGGEIGDLVSTCEVTCPALYGATRGFMLSLGLFTAALLLPIICLPFVYLWIVRIVTTEEAWARFGRVAAGETGNGSGSGGNEVVLAKDVMNELKEVVLVRDEDDNGGRGGGGGGGTVRIVGKVDGEEGDDLEEGKVSSDKTAEWHSVKDCAICKCEFESLDYATYIQKRNQKDNDEDDDGDTILVTKCGHLFHKSCISGWIYGEWNMEEMSTVRLNGRAKNRNCPLCREDLAPRPTTTTSSSSPSSASSSTTTPSGPSLISLA